MTSWLQTWYLCSNETKRQNYVHRWRSHKTFFESSWYCIIAKLLIKKIRLSLWLQNMKLSFLSRTSKSKWKIIFSKLKICTNLNAILFLHYWFSSRWKHYLTKQHFCKNLIFKIFPDVRVLAHFNEFVSQVWCD